MTALAQDIRYAFRTLGRSPGFTAIAIVTLALGIGANTAIFSVVHSVLLKPLPYPDPERLVVVTERTREGEQSVAWANFLDWRTESRAVERLAAYRTAHVTLSRSGDPALLRAGDVSAPFFPLLGTRAGLGRVFAETDDRPGAAPTVVLSDELWRSRFGADPAIVGKTVRIDGAARQVIGVLPPVFRFFAQSVDLYLPLGRHGGDPSWLDRGNHQGLRVLGRLRPGVALPQFRAELDTIMVRLEAEYPKSNSGQRTMVVPLFESQFSEVRPTLWSLFAAVALILLLSCANVAHLFLARAATRKREFAIRAAIGASRARILRQLLTESVVLAVAAGGLGLLLGVWAIGPLLRIAPVDIPRLAETRLDGAVLLFSLAASVLTGILFGLAPAVAAFRSHPQASLKESGPGATATRRGGRQRAGLFVGEVALAFLVVIGSGLLLRSLVSVRGVDPGFSADHVLAMDIILPDARYGSREQKRAFFAETLERLRALPGAEAASAALCPPLMGPCWGSVYVLSDRPAPAQADLPSAAVNVADPEYFRTLGIPLRRGRLFQTSDHETAPPVILINETMARLWWGAENPVGKRIKQGFPQDDAPFREIVGVVGDVRQEGLDSLARPEIFFPAAQMPTESMTILLRAAGDPMDLVRPAEAAVHSVDPDQPVSRVEPLERYFAESLARRHFTTLLLTIFGALALVLAATGIYGVVSYGVAERRRELGIRTALGARPADLVRLVVGQALRLAAVGLAIGAAAAFGLTRLLASLLFRVTPWDPVTFSGVAALLTAVVLAACALPARRATRIAPTSVLRAE